MEMALKQHSAETSDAQTVAPKRPGIQRVSAQMVTPKRRCPNVTYRGDQYWVAVWAYTLVLSHYAPSLV